MCDLAIKKLDEELSKLKTGSMQVQAMKKSVHDALVEFCRQDEEFAQAVYQGGSFTDCMTAVARDVRQSISDADAYRRAVQFYFPGADIRFHMSVNLCASVEPEQTELERRNDKPKVLDLFDLM